MTSASWPDKVEATDMRILLGIVAMLLLLVPAVVAGVIAGLIWPGTTGVVCLAGILLALIAMLVPVEGRKR